MRSSKLGWVSWHPLGLMPLHWGFSQRTKRFVPCASGSGNGSRLSSALMRQTTVQSTRASWSPVFGIRWQGEYPGQTWCPKMYSEGTLGTPNRGPGVQLSLLASTIFTVRLGTSSPNGLRLAALNCGCKVVGACRGSNPRTSCWTLEVKGGIRLKKDSC